MRIRNLSICTLQNIASGCVSDTGPSTAAFIKTRCMFAQTAAGAACLNPDHANRCIVQKRVKHTNRIRATSHAGNQNIGQSSGSLNYLGASFLSDNTLEVTYHHRVGMWAKRTAEKVMSCTG